MTIHPTPPPTPQTWAGLEAEERLRAAEKALATAKDLIRHQEAQILRLAEEAASVQDAKLGSAQRAVMVALRASRGELTIAELVEATGMTAPHAYNVVRALGKAGRVRTRRPGLLLLVGLHHHPMVVTDTRPSCLGGAVSASVWAKAVARVSAKSLTLEELAASLGVCQAVAARVARAGDKAGVWHRWRQEGRLVVSTEPPRDPCIRPVTSRQRDDRREVVLELLKQEHTTGQVARATGATVCATRKYLGRLEAEGVVERRPHPIRSDAKGGRPCVAWAVPGAPRVRLLEPDLRGNRRGEIVRLLSTQEHTIADLADAMDVNRVAIARIVRQLEEEGVVDCRGLVQTGGAPAMAYGIGDAAQRPSFEPSQRKARTAQKAAATKPAKRAVVAEQRKAIVRLMSERAVNTSEVAEALGLALTTAQNRITSLRRAGLVESCGNVGRNHYYRAVGSQVEAPPPQTPQEVAEDQWDSALDSILLWAYANQEALDRNLCTPPRPFGPLTLSAAQMDKALRELAEEGHLVRAGVIDGTPFYTTPTT